jgi:DNA mismatch repair ATPase MutS
VTTIRLYNEDAVKVTETLALKMEKHEADMKKGFTASVTFPVSQLDTFLQKLARSGARVVIRDAEGLADARNRTTGHNRKDSRKRPDTDSL